jgi:hypothetical protein
MYLKTLAMSEVQTLSNLEFLYNCENALENPILFNEAVWNEYERREKINLQASYPVVTGGSFPGIKAAGA